MKTEEKNNYTELLKKYGAAQDDVLEIPAMEFAKYVDAVKALVKFTNELHVDLNESFIYLQSANDVDGDNRKTYEEATHTLLSRVTKELYEIVKPIYITEV
ncbi:MAG: hypothetical protein LBV67_09520 [Streptococcaceae bacterium]|jgi:hypothetical protein|nr:hypothetical protein [Streptococcaceae bacterium]